MMLGLEDLLARLECDDEGVYDTIEAHFELETVGSSFGPRWRPRLELAARISSKTMGDQLIGLANGFQRRWRERRFERGMAERPELPVVVCEGDSWVAHPFIDDITDHLVEGESDTFHVHGVGAAADWLRDIAASGDYLRAIETHRAVALLLSGGGNDLLDAFPGFLAPWAPGVAPQRLLTPAVDVAIDAVMGIMRELLMTTAGLVPVVVVHGYDHLCVRKASGKGGTLGRFFDDAHIMERAERHDVLRLIVDRYNEALQRLVGELTPAGRECWVSYVDLRGSVPHEAGPCTAWNDDIHPASDGFGPITERLAAALRERVVATRAR